MNLKSILSFGIGLIALTVVVLLLMWLMFNAFATREAQLDRPPSPLADTRRLTPEPRLQVNPIQDLKELRAREGVLLNSYGWVNKDAGVVRIPIESRHGVIGGGRSASQGRQRQGNWRTGRRRDGKLRAEGKEGREEWKDVQRQSDCYIIRNIFHVLLFFSFSGTTSAQEFSASVQPAIFREIGIDQD